MTTISQQQPPHTLVVMMLISLAAITAVLPSPTIPVIGTYFHLSNNDAQTIISTYLLGYVIGQLIYGPIANRFGYKKALLLGISIALLGLSICTLSYFLQNFSILLAGRLISALGTSSCLVCSFILINDQFDRQRGRRVITFGVLALNVGSSLAITIGGILTVKINWMACYLFLFGYCCIALFAASRVKPHRFQTHPHALKIKTIVRGYWQSFSSTKLVAYGLMLSISSGNSYLYATASPLIAHNYLQLSPLAYSWCNLINVLGLLSGLTIMAKLADRFSERQFLWFCIPLQLLLGLALGLYIWDRFH